MGSFFQLLTEKTNHYILMFFYTKKNKILFAFNGCDT